MIAEICSYQYCLELKVIMCHMHSQDIQHIESSVSCPSSWLIFPLVQCHQWTRWWVSQGPSVSGVGSLELCHVSQMTQFPYIVHYLYIHMPPVQNKCTTGNRALFATQSVLWVIRMMLTWLYQRGSWVEPGSEASWENPWRDARQYPLSHGLVGIGKELTVVCSFNGSLNVQHIYVWIQVIYLNIFCKYLALERD